MNTQKQTDHWSNIPNQWFEDIEPNCEPLPPEEVNRLLDKINKFSLDLHHFRASQPEWFKLNFETYSPTRLEYDALRALEKCQENCKELSKKPGRKANGMVEYFQILSGIKK